MLRLITIVITIGLADSLNPSTIAPALYLATGERPRERVIEFTFGVVSVYLLGGILIALGPGQLLLSLVPHPGHQVRNAIETVVGITLIGASILLWRHRERFAEAAVPDIKPNRSTWFLGAGITALELPTAFPYFAAVATIVGSGTAAWRQLLLIVLFNLCFILPLVAISATLWLAGDRAEAILGRARAFLQRHWPRLLAGVLLVAGVFVMALGLTGFISGTHGRLGRIARRLHHVLTP